MEKPNDRFSVKDTLAKSQDKNPKIVKSAELKIPDKELGIKQGDAAAPDYGTCTCHSVCNCVQVSSCACDTVCTCDSVCNMNPTCTCDPFSACSAHPCECQPLPCYTKTCHICTCVPIFR